MWGHENPVSNASSSVYGYSYTHNSLSRTRSSVKDSVPVAGSFLPNSGHGKPRKVLQEQPRAGQKTQMTLLFYHYKAGKNWRQNKCQLLSVLLDSTGWEENTKRELTVSLLHLLLPEELYRGRWNGTGGEGVEQGKYSRDSANSTSLESVFSEMGHLPPLRATCVSFHTPIIQNFFHTSNLNQIVPFNLGKKQKCSLEGF